MKIPDQSIDFLGLDIIHLLHCSFDLLLVGPDVNNENQSVVVFNLLHCRFCGQRVLENLIVVKLISWWRTDTRVLRVSVSLQCPRTMKGNLGADLLGLLFKG
ncbi:hypothetical protein Hanom_Chr12g01106101 [Helianthus anomalus]